MSLWETCSLCSWTDNGQDDDDADQCLGEPNGHLSLAQARLNFQRNLTIHDDLTDVRFRRSEELRAEKAAALDALLSLAASENAGEFISRCTAVADRLRELREKRKQLRGLRPV
jgi:hypothetical protein